MKYINVALISIALSGAVVVPAQAQYYGGGSGYHHFGPHHSYSISGGDIVGIIGAVGTLIHGGGYGPVIYQTAPPIFYQPAPLLMYGPNGPITMPSSQIPVYGYGHHH